MILAKTVKGWALGSAVEGRNATHQIKKLNLEQLKDLRRRLHLDDEIPDSVFDGEDPPYYRPAEDSPEYRYLMDRRRALDGVMPRRTHRGAPARSPCPSPRCSRSSPPAPAARPSPPPWPSPACCAAWPATPEFGPRVVPIIPDEARTFGMDALFRELKIYAAHGQLYEPVDASLLLSYTEGKDGQILEEGITEAGAMASFTAAGTSYATRGVPMVPFFIFYSMFGFQRVGDLIWAAADAQAKGFLHRRHRRAHHAARRGPPAPGRPQPRAGLHGADRARPTTRPSPTSWPPSSSTASTECTAARAARRSTATASSTT